VTVTVLERMIRKFSDYLVQTPNLKEKYSYAFHFAKTFADVDKLGETFCQQYRTVVPFGTARVIIEKVLSKLL